MKLKQKYLGLQAIFMLLLSGSLLFFTLPQTAKAAATTCLDSTSFTTSNTKVLINKNTLYPDESFDWIVYWNVPAAYKDLCKKAVNDKEFNFQTEFDVFTSSGLGVGATQWDLDSIPLSQEDPKTGDLTLYFAKTSTILDVINNGVAQHGGQKMFQLFGSWTYTPGSIDGWAFWVRIGGQGAFVPGGATTTWGFESPWVEIKDPKDGKKDPATHPSDPTVDDFIKGKTISQPGTPPGTPGSSTGTTNTDNGSSTIFSFLADLFVGLFSLVNKLIFYLFGLVIAPMLAVLLSIRTYTDAFSSVIYPGWEILRNLSNILFIIGLLIIAIATIFRIQSYQYKHLLVNLIIAALLVNFSLIIGQSVLGIAETVQNQFLPNSTVTIKALGKAIMVTPIQQIQNSTMQLPTDLGGSVAKVVTSFFMLVLALGGLLTFGAILVYLLIRIVWLWFLLMTSPIPYVSNVLPITKQYVGKWWTTFLRYAFFVPIMGLFLEIAAAFADKFPDTIAKLGGNAFPTSTAGGATSFLVKSAEAAGNNTDFNTFVFNILAAMLLLFWLIIALRVANAFGIYSAKAITDFVEKGMKLPGGIAKWGAERSFEGLQNKIGVDLDPRIWAKSLKEYSAKQKEARIADRYKKWGGYGQASELIKRFDPTSGKNLNRWFNLYRYSALGRVGAKAWENKKTAFEDKAKILTDEERTEKMDKLTAARNEKNSALARAQAFQTSGLIDKEYARSTANAIGGRIEELTSEKASALETASQLDLQGRGPEANQKRREAAELQQKIEDLTTSKTDLEHQAELIEAGRLDEARLSAASLPGDAKNEIEKLMEKRSKTLEPEITELSDEVRKDDERRSQYGVSSWADKDKQKALNDAKKFAERANDLRVPETRYATTLRMKKEAEEGKSLDGIDDRDELLDRLEEAVAKNNGALATAIAKKMAKANMFGDVLSKFGHEANFEGFQKFIETNLKKPVGNNQELMKIASEISGLNLANKAFNMAFMTEVKNRKVQWTDPAKHFKLMGEKMAKMSVQEAFRNLGAGNYVTKDAAGKYSFQAGGLGFLKDVGQENAKAAGRMPSYVAKELMKVPNWESILRSEGVNSLVISHIKNAVNKSARPS